MEVEKKKVCRMIVLGAGKVGKSAIISQFLTESYQTRHKSTHQRVHNKNIAINLSLEILELGGAFAEANPDILELSLSRVDIFLLVFSSDHPDSLNTVTGLRDLVRKIKGTDVPIIVAENKVDLKKKPKKKDGCKVPKQKWKTETYECSARMNLNITNLFKDLLEISFRRKVKEDASCFSSERKLTNTKSQLSQPTIPTFVEIMKTKFNRGRSKSESDKQDNLSISDFLDYYNTASTRQENIRRVGTIPRFRRSKSVTASEFVLEKEINQDGNKKKEKIESSNFVVKVTKRFRLLRSKSQSSESKREQNAQNPYHRTGRRCSVAESTKLIPRSKTIG